MVQFRFYFLFFMYILEVVLATMDNLGQIEIPNSQLTLNGLGKNTFPLLLQTLQDHLQFFSFLLRGRLSGASQHKSVLPIIW